MALLGVGEFRQVGDVSAAGALGPGAIQVAFNAAVPAVGQVAQQVGLYQVKVFLRHQRITLEEGALPVDDGKTSR